MKIDLYTKAVLTIIALALSVIALRGTFSGTAYALGDGCGNSLRNPCYVSNALAPIEVKVVPY